MEAKICTGPEINIALPRSDVPSLEKQVVSCMAEVVGAKIKRKIEFSVGQTANLYFDMEPFPAGADFENQIEYSITMSHSGYELLKTKGRVQGRTSGVSKVYVHAV